MRAENGTLFYFLLIFVALGVIGGMCFIGVPAKAEASEQLLFFLAGFIVPSGFIMWDNFETNEKERTKRSSFNQGERTV